MLMSNYSISVYAYCNKGYDPMDILRELNEFYFTVECQYYPDTSPAGFDYYIFTVPLNYHPINDDGGNEIHDVIEALNHVAGEGRYRMIIEENFASSKVIFSSNPNFEKKGD